jgi:hypothetical protein
MEDLAFDVLNARNGGHIGLHVESSTYCNMRAVEGALFSVIVLVLILYSMLPALVDRLVKWLDTGDAAPELDEGLQGKFVYI